METKSTKLIDLKSDTVTRPSQRMKDAMFNCELGDDVLGDDPTVLQMQRQVADFFGKEAALMMNSGCQSNLCSLMTNVPTKGYTAVVGNKSHIYMYERGSASAIGNIFLHVVKNQKDGTMALKDIRKEIPIVNEHLAMPSVICLENSHGGCDGASLPFEHVQEVKQLADTHGIKMHLDGARLLNALVHSGQDPKEHCAPFDTISICFSKGLGCPIGSVLLGSEKDIRFARNIRKMLGGGMRQAGIIAACMQVAMEDWHEKLKTDNDNCKFIATELNSNVDGAYCNLDGIHTNMFSFKLEDKIT